LKDCRKGEILVRLIELIRQGLRTGVDSRPRCEVQGDGKEEVGKYLERTAFLHVQAAPRGEVENYEPSSHNLVGRVI